MPIRFHIKPSRKMVDSCKTDSGAFTGAQVKAIGLKWNSLPKGWTFRLTQSYMPLDTFLNFYHSRLILKKSKNKHKNTQLFENKPRWHKINQHDLMFK